MELKYTVNKVTKDTKVTVEVNNSLCRAFWR